ncbi:MAG TPA: TonB-dependent receptor [Aggregatilineales bacterium]|nr:TonB-dependent receptor [Aggregatilineales bacterium]
MLLTKIHRARLLQTACSVIALNFLLSQAHAQDGVETVTVTGQQYAVEKSINNKRELNVVSDGISSDDIGSIPEYGLGDALRKVPGVALQINNGRGEDQFITLRGLNPDYNSIEIDGLQLASTEETRRQVSLDVLPSVLVSAVNVAKSWTVDQVSDAAGGVTMLKTRSAFDRPGEHLDAHLDYAYWENTEQVHSFQPSGQGDVTYSNTFGDSNQFGLVLLASYMRRSSSTLNTYTLGYSYYPYAGSGTANVPALDQAGATATTATLKPTDSVAGLVPIPDRHRWYWYDNDRTRPGVFGRLDFDDHSMFQAHVAGGLFEFINDENRWSQYLNRVGNATINSPTTGSFAQGAPEVDYDRYVQLRQMAYVDVGGGMNLSNRMHLDATFNYGVGQYKQTTNETQFTAPTSATYAFNYDLAAPQSALFIPNNSAAFTNPANYTQVYFLNATDASINHLPQAKLEFTDNMDSDSEGLGFKLGWTWRDLNQHYFYHQARLNPNQGTAPTLAAAGVMNKTISLYDGEGQSLLLVDPYAVGNYVTNNAANYSPNATDALSNTVNNYRLGEAINAFYGEAQYKWNALYAVAGVRYETTDMSIANYQPVPFSSTTNFVQTQTASHYYRLLPSLNVSYDLTDDLKLRGAITQNLARPQYAQLAQNGTASLNGANGTASETISNPNLKPRESTNYDLSAEYYPAQGVLLSVAVFDKEIENEIVSLTTTVPNATVPGVATPVTLTITQAQNTDSASIQGLELGASDVKFNFLPDFLSDFGGTANASFVSENTPHIRMSNGSLRRLPQLMESSRFVANVALLYSHDAWAGELAYNYTSKMPISFDTNNQVNDQWWTGITTLDSQVSYSFDENISARFQVKNMTNSRPQKVVGLNQQLNYSALDNGRAFFFGVGVSY